MSRLQSSLTALLYSFALFTLVALGPAELVAQADPPPPMTERPIEFPPFEEFTLENGLRVIVLSYGTQPVMSARLYAPGGAALLDPSQAGLAGLTATVLTKGTESRTADEISEFIEGVGGSVGASGGQDFFSVSVSALTEHMDTAFELLEDVVLRATFPEDEVELARRQTLSSLQAQLGQPQAIANRRFSTVVYGDHPYGVSSTPSTVESITRDDMVALRDRLLQPSGALLVVAGQVERAEIETRVREHFGDWAPGTPPEVDFPDVPTRGETRIYLVNRPGSVQSVVRVGHPGVEPDHPDYFPLVVMNRVLGGGADARLFQILREERGWTYGAYSSFSRPADLGSFSATAEVRTEVTDSTTVEILRQMERLRTEPVPEEELDAARNFLAGSFPLRLETADQVAGQLATTFLLGLPVTDVTEYPTRIRSVTAADVQRVAQAHLHPDRAAIIVVGDGARILEPLEAVAPVELFDIEGAPIAREDVVGEREPVSWNPAILEEGVRRYEYFVQGNPMGAAEYRLERQADDWVSTVSVTAAGSTQETELRFDATDFTPRSLRQTQSQGAIQIDVDLRVEDGQLVGQVELPEQLGGTTEFDQPLSPGMLLPGMDEYALAISELSEGARIDIPYLDATSGEPVQLQARVTGSETLDLGEGRSFDVWRVEVSGGPAPLTLYLMRDAPHLMVRQEFTGQPVRIDLMGISPL